MIDTRFCGENDGLLLDYVFLREFTMHLLVFEKDINAQVGFFDIRCHNPLIKLHLLSFFLLLSIKSTETVWTPWLCFQF